MNRLIALLLIPLLAAGNMFPRCHGDSTGFGNANNRPHIHLGSVHHHHHDQFGGDIHGHHSRQPDTQASGGQSRPGTLAPNEYVSEEHPTAKHDVDTVYLPTASYMLPGKMFVLPQAPAAMPAYCRNESFSTLFSSIRMDRWMQLLVPAELPLFLFFAALRL